MRTAEELRFLVLAVQREGNRMFAAELRPLGITPSQAEVLRVLQDYGPLTLTELGELLVCETGNSPSRLVDRLVLQGLIRRGTDRRDRRYLTLSLTPRGRQLCRRIITAEERLYRKIDGLLGRRPVTQTLNTLRAVAEAFPAGAALARRRQADRTSYKTVREM